MWRRPDVTTEVAAPLPFDIRSPKAHTKSATASSIVASSSPGIFGSGGTAATIRRNCYDADPTLSRSIFGSSSDENLLFLLVLCVGGFDTRGQRHRLLLLGDLESLGEGFLYPGLLCSYPI